MVNAWERFHDATLELVRSAPIKQRLISAYRHHLADLQEEQLPGELRESFTRMQRSLSGVPPLRGEDSVAASVRKMSNHDADEWATLIVEIFGSISRAHATPLRPAAVPLKPRRASEQRPSDAESDEVAVPQWLAKA